ncbi:MAG: methyltransferase domain-containing protein [Actinomycetota bacterium]|nr:methyltransferase domain-containing protein [Actinomycetota bacterium]
MVDRQRARRSVRTAVVWDVLRSAVDDRAVGARAVDNRAVGDRADAGVAGLDVLDAGGGTGGFAVPLAELGHRVTVVDPSPDALAALERRAREAGVTERVRALQGDTSGLADLVPPASVDLTLCHGVLEHVDDAGAAVAALTATLRPGGLLSLLTAQRSAAVLARALAGHFTDATRVLTDDAGRWGADDPVPHRFTEDELCTLAIAAGLDVRSVHGIRVVSDLVPGALLDLEPGNAEALLALEHAAAGHPELRAVATQLHLLAQRR